MDNNLGIYDLKNRVVQALADEKSILRQHLPPTEQINKVLQDFEQAKGNYSIADLDISDYANLYKAMRTKNDGSLPPHQIMKEDDLLVSVNIFNKLVQENKLQSSTLDKQDLEVLCIIQNTISFNKNRHLFLRNFSRGD